jgi:hypothetical protein
MMVRSAHRGLAVLVLVALSSTGSAQTRPTEEQRNACRDDAMKLCASEGGIRSCLESQKDKLSAACRQAMGWSQSTEGNKNPPNPWKDLPPLAKPTR